MEGRKSRPSVIWQMCSYCSYQRPYAWLPITPTERNKGLKTIVKLQRLHVQIVLPSFACFNHFNLNNNKKKMEIKKEDSSVSL